MNERAYDRTSPHKGQPIARAGLPLADAEAVMIMLHGRGASAENILELAGELDVPGFAFLAPQAAGGAWYPYSFLAPLEDNEPWLSSALEAVDTAIARAVLAGHEPKQIVLLGFSQGACLMLEYAARHAQRYGGLVGLSGGLIGPEGTPRTYAGSLAGTPTFLGCSDVDPHIPKLRVEESEAVLRGMGADVTARLYAGMGHTVNMDEINAVRGIMRGILPTGA